MELEQNKLTLEDKLSYNNFKSNKKEKEDGDNFSTFYYDKLTDLNKKVKELNNENKSLKIKLSKSKEEFNEIEREKDDYNTLPGTKKRVRISYNNTKYEDKEDKEDKIAKYHCLKDYKQKFSYCCKKIESGYCDDKFCKMKSPLLLCNSVIDRYGKVILDNLYGKRCYYFKKSDYHEGYNPKEGRCTYAHGLNFTWCDIDSTSRSHNKNCIFIHKDDDEIIEKYHIFENFDSSFEHYKKYGSFKKKSTNEFYL